jgi:hypothetical protein
MRAIALLTLVVLGLPELGFCQADKAPETVTKIVRVRHGSPVQIAKLAGGGTKVFMGPDDTLQVIVLKGDPTQVAAVEQTIHELDGLGTDRDVEVIVTVVGASSNPDMKSIGPLTPDIASVTRQLQSIFPYKSYQVLTSMLLRSREDTRAINSGVMKSLSSAEAAQAQVSRPSTYTVGYDRASVSNESGKPSIHIRNFRFGTKIPVINEMLGSKDSKGSIIPYATTQVSLSQVDVSIMTDIDIRDGQKVVVGKANVENGDSAIFVVVGARLVE